ncbi:hypothetical protein [Marinobacter sp.]|uniref:hypothetical protein n=1 Tax=Marinobacter sp. TaxID=50741 RepID=UPI001B6195C7|nr:hypothetical protein [Marinobacter sp.]MBQ0833263.1 hypothetical protein [Marinobacter sp.]
MHDNKNNSDKAATQQKQKAAGIRSATKTKIERERIECFGYFAFLVVPWHVRVVEMQIRITLEVTQHLPMTRSMSLTAHCVQSFPFALLRSLKFEDTQWGTKTKKNPGKK